MTITITFAKGSDTLVLERSGDSASTIPIVDDLRSYLETNHLSVLTVANGEGVTVRAELPELRAILAALQPDDESVEEFEAEVDEIGDRIHEFSAMGSVQINGEEWGWLRDDQGWKPTPKGEGREIASMSAWMSASMTGAFLTAGIRAWDNGTAMLWFDDDESNPEGDRIELTYQVENWADS